MRKTGFAVALAAMLIVPSAAMAAPTKADSKAASKQCHAERTAAGTKANFLAVGDPDYKNFGDCVSRGAKEEAAERRAARKAARASCAAQDLKGKELAACVKAATKENKAEADAQDKEKVNAAKSCREQQGDAEAFAAAYGTGKNAFGKCVSKTAQAKNDDEEETTETA
jgi:hypothetical protein